VEPGSNLLPKKRIRFESDSKLLPKPKTATIDGLHGGRRWGFIGVAGRVQQIAERHSKPSPASKTNSISLIASIDSCTHKAAAGWSE